MEVRLIKFFSERYFVCWACRGRRVMSLSLTEHGKLNHQKPLFFSEYTVLIYVFMALGKFSCMLTSKPKNL